MCLSNVGVSVTGPHNRIARDYFPGYKKLRVTALTRSYRHGRHKNCRRRYGSSEVFMIGIRKAKANLADEPEHRFFSHPSSSF